VWVGVFVCIAEVEHSNPFLSLSLLLCYVDLTIAAVVSDFDQTLDDCKDVSESISDHYHQAFAFSSMLKARKEKSL
jgi:hypothetical protein